MAVTEAFVMSAVTISTTEISILSGTSTLQNSVVAGCYQLIVDGVAAAMAKGDEFAVKIYEKCKGASTKRVIAEARIADVQTQPYVFPPIMLLNGWDMTLLKIAGTDRAFDASVRKAG